MQVGLSTHQRRPLDLPQSSHLLEGKDALGMVLPLHLNQTCIMKEKRRLGRSCRPLTHEDLAETGCLLQPSSDVDRISGQREIVARGVVGYNDLTRVSRLSPCLRI